MKHERNLCRAWIFASFVFSTAGAQAGSCGARVTIGTHDATSTRYAKAFPAGLPAAAACEGRSPHGFLQQEAEVAAGIARFIGGARY